MKKGISSLIVIAIIGGILILGGRLFATSGGCSEGDTRCNAINNQNIDLCSGTAQIPIGLWDTGSDGQGYPYCDTGYGCSNSETTCGEYLVEPPCCILGLYCDEGESRCDPMDETKIQDCIGNAWVYADTCPSGQYCVDENLGDSITSCEPFQNGNGACVPYGGSWINSPDECCNVACQDKRCVNTVEECGQCGCSGTDCTSDTDCCQYPQCGVPQDENLYCFNGKCISSECGSDQDCTDKYGAGWRCREETGECFSTSPCTSHQECINKFGPGYICERNGQCVYLPYYDLDDWLRLYPWILILIPIGIGYFLTKGKKRKKAMVIGGVIGFVFYIFYTSYSGLSLIQKWLLGLGIGTATVGIVALFFMLGGGSLIMYWLTSRRK